MMEVNNCYKLLRVRNFIQQRAVQKVNVNPECNNNNFI